MFSAGVTNAENTERREPGYFVLSKTMAYDVINDNTERLRENLAVQSPEDIETFAHILKASHPDVDKLICKFGKRIVLTAEDDKLRTHFSDTLKNHGGDCDGKRHGVWKWFDTEKDPGLVAAVSGRGTGQWPKISQATWWCFESGAEPCPRVDASSQIAGEIADMGPDNKAVVAGHIAKVVEGGEVVEIRDVSSTSVMINSCYDMPKTRYGLGAYACLGLGSNLIRVSSGELIAKPAYIQSPVDIKLPCPSIHTLPMDIPKHAVTCVATLIILHNDHSSHPDVDRLFCRNGVKLVLENGLGYQIEGRMWSKGEEFGRDCSGIKRAQNTGLESKGAGGFVAALSGRSHGKWPMVSKAATWGIAGPIYDNWGGSKEVREAEKTRMADEKGLTTLWRHCHRDKNQQTWRCRDLSDTEKAYKYWDNLMKRYEIPARARWLSENPGWLDEERRRLEVDASSQVAGEIAEMGTEIKAVCEVKRHRLQIEGGMSILD